MPGHVRDLRQRKTQPYNGAKPMQARWHHPDDPRVKRERSFATKREARAWLADQDTDARRGVWVDPNRGREVFSVVVEQWLEANRHQIAPKTRAVYTSILNRHILPVFGERRVSGLSTDDMQRFVNTLADQRSPKTVQNVMMIMRSVLYFAVLRGLIAVSPCTGLRLAPGRRQKHVTPLPHDQLALLADAMPDPVSRAAVLVAGYCGLRAGEVWALRRGDVMLRRLRVDEKITQAPVTDLDQGYTPLPNGLAVGPTKTFNDETVAMPAVVAEALALLITPAMQPDDFIMVGEDGWPIKQSGFYTNVYKPTLLVALPEEYHGFTFHDLRHTCAAYMIESGFHPKVIQTQMRHASIQITMDTYGHLFSDALDAVADAMDAGYRSTQQPAAKVQQLKR